MVEGWLLGVILGVCLGIIGSRWFPAVRHWPERFAMGFFIMLLAVPTLLYVANKLLGWQITLPTLLIVLFLFLVVGGIVSKNVRKAF